jgi:hypothetical protein
MLFLRLCVACGVGLKSVLALFGSLDLRSEKLAFVRCLRLAPGRPVSPGFFSITPELEIKRKFKPPVS